MFYFYSSLYFSSSSSSFFFFFNDTATTEIYTLSLHDALPICQRRPRNGVLHGADEREGEAGLISDLTERQPSPRSEEHTSELQSPCNLVCRLLLEKKKKKEIKKIIGNKKKRIMCK